MTPPLSGNRYVCSQLPCFNRIIQFLLLQADVSRKRKWFNFSKVILSGWTLMYHVDRLAAKVQLSKLAHLAWHRFRQRSFPTAWRCAQNINCASCLWIPALKRAPFSLKYDYLWGLWLEFGDLYAAALVLPCAVSTNKLVTVSVGPCI